MEAKEKVVSNEETKEKLAVPVTRGELVIRPELNIIEAKQLWDDYKDFREYILKDPNCYDEIEGNKEMNRTGATRLAVPFGLTIEERFVEATPIGDDQRFVVHIRVSKGQRFVDGAGSCRVSEIAEKTRTGKDVPVSQREHFAYSKAWTRAVKRGIADMLGGTEAEEPEKSSPAARATQSEGFKGPGPQPKVDSGQRAIVVRFLEDVLGEDLVELIKLEEKDGELLVILPSPMAEANRTRFLKGMMTIGQGIHESNKGLVARMKASSAGSPSAGQAR